MSEQLKQYIADLLRESQDDGYVIEENTDYEVAQWIELVSRQIAEKADRLLEPERYFKYQGKFYKVKDLQKLQEVQL